MADQQWVDLSRNVPGQLVGEEATARWRAEGAQSARSWQRGADGEWDAAAALVGLVTISRWDRLRGRRPRWWVLHSVPVGVRSSDIDHVIGGPPGVFTVNTKHHRTGRVDIVDDEVRVNRHRTEYVAKSRFEAERAQRLLGAALVGEGEAELAVRVRVRPVLAIVGARIIGGNGQAGGVLVDRPAALPFRLRSTPEVLDDEQVTALFEVARRSTTWARA